MYNIRFERREECVLQHNVCEVMDTRECIIGSDECYCFPVHASVWRYVWVSWTAHACVFYRYSSLCACVYVTESAKFAINRAAAFFFFFFCLCMFVRVHACKYLFSIECFGVSMFKPVSSVSCYNIFLCLCVRCSACCERIAWC